MANPSKLYFNNDFSASNAKHCMLLIQIRETNFSFAVVSKDNMTVWGKYLPLTELTEPKDIKEYLDLDYAKVVIGLTPEVFTIVPKQLYTEESAAAYAQILDVSTTDKVYTQSLDTENLILFKDNNTITAGLQEKYKNTKISFFYKGWIEAITKAQPLWQNVYLDIQHELLSILYLKNGKLRFYNCFNYQSIDELVYFTALVTTELNLKQQEIKLVLSGDVTLADRHVIALSEFYQKVEISENQIQPLPPDIAQHQVLSITALSLCV